MVGGVRSCECWCGGDGQGKGGGGRAALRREAEGKRTWCQLLVSSPSSSSSCGVSFPVLREGIPRAGGGICFQFSHPFLFTFVFRIVASRSCFLETMFFYFLNLRLLDRNQCRTLNNSMYSGSFCERSACAHHPKFFLFLLPVAG